MGSEQELPSSTRTVVPRREAGLILITILSGVPVLLSIGLAYAAVLVGGPGGWVIVPVGLFAVAGFGLVCGWSIRRRAVEEPAMILDDAGIYDNISLARAGRVRWREIERVWPAGPSWMPLLCIMPRDLWAYLERQEDWRRWVMRLNKGLFGAPVVIPAIILQISDDDLWLRLGKAEIASRSSSATLI